MALKFDNPFKDIIVTIDNAVDIALKSEDNEWLWAFSGGGVKGSFEAGVALYLSREQAPESIRPAELHGSSTGSLTCLKLSEGRSGAQQIADIYRSLRTWSDMFDISPEFNQLRLLINAEDKRLGGSRLLNRQSKGAMLGVAFGTLTHYEKRALEEQNRNDTRVPEFPDIPFLELGENGGVEGLYTFTKLVGLGLISLGIAEVLGVGSVTSTILSLKRIRDQLEEFEKNGNSLASTMPLKRLLNQSVVLSKINPNIRLRMQTVDLATGKSLWINSSGFVIDETGKRFRRGQNRKTALINGALASAAIPVFFPPVAVSYFNGSKKQTSVCVDGGVRDIFPASQLQEFIDRAQKNNKTPAILAVFASPITNRVKHKKWDQNKKTLEDTAARSAEIVLDEIYRSDVEALQQIASKESAILKTIAPSHEVLSTVDVEPGLIAINIAYGYMRAFDEFLPSRKRRAARRSTDLIIKLRQRAWELERKHVRFIAESEPFISSPYFGKSLAPDVALMKRLAMKGAANALYNGFGVRRRLFAKFINNARSLFRIMPAHEVTVPQGLQKPKGLLRLKRNIERTWQNLGGNVNDIIIWEENIPTTLRQIKNEIQRNTRLRAERFGTESLPIEFEDIGKWWTEFEQHHETESLEGVGFHYTPWSTHFDIKGRRVPSVV